jgi:malate dehydrogenase
MDVTIVGAGGGCGREIVKEIIQQRLLEYREILQLVGSNPHSSHPHQLLGFRADLQDAYAEIIPEINVTDDPERIIGDVVVIAGGVTFSTSTDQIGTASRDMLARGNIEVFERFARSIGRTRPLDPPVVIVVTNPVELGVKIFSQYIPRENVIGMGAFSDSSRFRWEIASELGIRRQRVHGYMLGEHGSGLIPIWSSVRVHGMTEKEWKLAEQQIRRGLTTKLYHQALSYHQAKLIEMMKGDRELGPAKALDYVSDLPPDLRVALKPFAIHYTHAKTQTATAAATTELVKAVLEGRHIEIAAQFMHDGENGLHGPFGSRVILAGNIQRVVPNKDIYTETELALITKISQQINAKIAQWMN